MRSSAPAPRSPRPPGSGVDLRLEPRVDGVLLPARPERHRTAANGVSFRLPRCALHVHDRTEPGRRPAPPAAHVWRRPGSLRHPARHPEEPRVRPTRVSLSECPLDLKGGGESRAQPVRDGIPDAQARRGDRMQNDAERSPRPGRRPDRRRAARCAGAGRIRITSRAVSEPRRRSTLSQSSISRTKHAVSMPCMHAMRSSMASRSVVRSAGRAEVGVLFMAATPWPGPCARNSEAREAREEPWQRPGRGSAPPVA
jgi:hypothetical protein